MWILAGTIVVAALVPLVAGCPGVAPARTERHPMILIGVDGMDWAVMRPLIAAGKLPVMRGLMERGRFGYLSSMIPTWSPVIWTSIATGKTPAKHGIESFVYNVKVGDKSQPRVYTSGLRRTKAFWNILSDEGLTVNVIGWWITYPAEPIHGVMVSQTNTTAAANEPRGNAIWKGSLIKGLPDQVHPLERQDEVMSILDDVDRELPRLTREVYGERFDPVNPFGHEMWKESQWAIRADATYQRVARKVLGAPYDLLAVYFGAPDVVSHRFWRYAHPEAYTHPPAQAEIEGLGGVIDATYEEVDRAIGELLAAQPPDVTVMIVSDHGFHAVNRDGLFRLEDSPAERNSGNHLDGPPGVFLAAGRYIAPASEPGTLLERLEPGRLVSVGSVLDITPTLLVMKGISVGADMDGVPLRAVIAKERLAEAPIQTVPTHDTAQWIASRPAPEAASAEDAERLEQLRSLGYIQ